MQPSHHPDQAIGSERPRAYRRRKGVPWAGAALVAVSLALGACGSSGGSTVTLNTTKIERAIAQSSLAQRGQHAQVSCPPDVPMQKGLEFSCMAKVGQVSTRFVVVEQDSVGHVHYEAP
jgi:Domain of unknown function (DUF4333)